MSLKTTAKIVGLISMVVGVAILALVLGAMLTGCYHGSPPWPTDPTQPPEPNWATSPTAEWARHCHTPCPLVRRPSVTVDEPLPISSRVYTDCCVDADGMMWSRCAWDTRLEEMARPPEPTPPVARGAPADVPPPASQPARAAPAGKKKK